MRIIMTVAFIFCGQAFAISPADVSRDPSLLLSADNKQLQALSTQVNPAASKKLKNFAQIKAKMEDCLGNLEDARNLKGSILSGGLSDPCIAGGFSYNKPTDVVYDLSDIANVANFAAAKKMIAERSLTNSARAIFDYRSQFEGAKALPSINDPVAMDKLAKDICSSCTEEQKQFFKKAFTQQVKSNPQTGSKFSLDSLIYQQNQTLEGLNSSIAKMEAAKNNKDEKAFAEAYDRYLGDYQRFAGTPAGALFMTDEIRDVVGKLITPESASKQFWLVGDVTFARHNLLDKTIKCVGKAICNPRERTRMKKALYEIEDKVGEFTNKAITANSFQELLKVDPALAGQMLVINPALFSEVCGAIKEIAMSDAKLKGNLESLDSVVGAIDTASMALMVTGVGGVAGKGIGLVARLGVKAAKQAFVSNLKSSAGRSAITSGIGGARVGNVTAGQIMARTAVVGAVSEVGHAVSDGGQMFQQSGYRDVLVASRMARATNELDVKRLSEIENKWSSSLGNLVKGTAINALPLAHGLMKIRSSKFMSSFFKGKNDLPTELAVDERILSMVNSLGNNGGKIIADAMARGKIDADGLAGALVAASQMEGGAAKLLKGLQSNADGILSELAAAGKKALSCAI